jgi:hypothetical protein
MEHNAKKEKMQISDNNPNKHLIVARGYITPTHPPSWGFSFCVLHEFSRITQFLSNPAPTNY